MQGVDFVVGERVATDWDAVRSIYEEGIAAGNATIETESPTWDVWNNRHLPHCRFVARSGNTVIGWVALSPVSSRCAYNGVAELSVYVAESARGQGVGTALLSTVIAGAEHNGIWTIQAGVFPDNPASLALHRKLGFRQVGIRERLGKLRGI